MMTSAYQSTSSLVYGLDTPIRVWLTLMRFHSHWRLTENNSGLLLAAADIPMRIFERIYTFFNKKSQCKVCIFFFK